MGDASFGKADVAFVIQVPFAACRIKKVFPDMKFIVILRNPTDRAYSEFDMVRTRCRGSGPIKGKKTVK